MRSAKRARTEGAAQRRGWRPERDDSRGEARARARGRRARRARGSGRPTPAQPGHRLRAEQRAAPDHWPRLHGIIRSARLGLTSVATIAIRRRRHVVRAQHIGPHHRGNPGIGPGAKPSGPSPVGQERVGQARAGRVSTRPLFLRSVASTCLKPPNSAVERAWSHLGDQGGSSAFEAPGTRLADIDTTLRATERHPSCPSSR
jgi:hypothetical protein